MLSLIWHIKARHWHSIAAVNAAPNWRIIRLVCAPFQCSFAHKWRQLVCRRSLSQLSLEMPACSPLRCDCHYGEWGLKSMLVLSCFSYFARWFKSGLDIKNERVKTYFLLVATSKLSDRLIIALADACNDDVQRRSIIFECMYVSFCVWQAAITTNVYLCIKKLNYTYVKIIICIDQQRLPKSHLSHVWRSNRRGGPALRTGQQLHETATHLDAISPIMISWTLSANCAMDIFFMAWK